MVQIGKLMILVGGAIVLLGLLVWLLGRTGFKGLPGDIHIEGQHGSLTFPIVTCLVLSALLSLALYVWRNWGGK